MLHPVYNFQVMQEQFRLLPSQAREMMEFAQYYSLQLVNKHFYNIISTFGELEFWISPKRSVTEIGFLVWLCDFHFFAFTEENVKASR